METTDAVSLSQIRGSDITLSHISVHFDWSEVRNQGSLRLDLTVCTTHTHTLHAVINKNMRIYHFYTYIYIYASI